MSRPIRVLVAEDDRIQRTLLAEGVERSVDLELAGLAADGQRAYDLALTARPDVILLDLVLPGLDGLELLRRYRQAGGRAGVVVLTRAGGANVTGLALAQGADYVLVKPAPWSQVARTVRMVSGGLSRLCLALLLDMGARERWAGTVQAARCAGALGEGRCALLKEAYIDAAALDRCTPQAVEKNIRSLIARLRAQASPAYVALFGPGQRPANSDFLRLLAHRAALGGGTWEGPPGC